jgi:hypothetical protein
MESLVFLPFITRSDYFIILLLFTATSSEAQINYVLRPVGNDVEEGSRCIDFCIDLEGRRITINNVRIESHQSSGRV